MDFTNRLWQSYNEALRHFPNNVSLWSGRGRILEYLGRIEESITAYETAVEKGGSSWEIGSWLGKKLSELYVIAGVRSEVPARFRKRALAALAESRELECRLGDNLRAGPYGMRRRFVETGEPVEPPKARSPMNGLRWFLVASGLSHGVCAVEPHPRILVTRADIFRVRSMAKDATPTPTVGMTPAAGWARIRAKADAFLEAGPYHYAVAMPGRNGGPSEKWEYTLSDESPPRHDEFRHYPPWTAMFQERGDAITTRLKYLLAAGMVTGEDKYFARAKKIVMHLCAWPQIWTDLSYGGGKPCLDTGHAAVWVAIFYDWTRDRLTDEEARRVRTALIEKAILPIDAAIDGVPVYHNYNAVIATGLGIGAIALIGEDARAEKWLPHAVSRVRGYLDAQGKDGGFMEGPMYGTYAADRIGDLLRALDTAGVPSPLWEHPTVAALPRYAITLLDPGSDRQPCFGDGGLTAGFPNLMRALALRGDSDAAWYCLRIKAFEPNAPGPMPGKSTDWRRYRFSATVPDGTEDVCLALQFFGKGQCWYDDVEVTADPPVPDSGPARITQLGPDTVDGVMVEVDGRRAILLTGSSGHPRTVKVAGHALEVASECTVVLFTGEDRATVFAPDGQAVRMDGTLLPSASGTWRLGE